MRPHLLKHPAKMPLGASCLYNIKENNELNFDKKIQRMQTKLDMWSSRDLKIFGRAMLIKILAISQLVYSASNLDLPGPQGIADIVKKNILSSSRKIKKIK